MIRCQVCLAHFRIGTPDFSYDTNSVQKKCIFSPEPESWRIKIKFSLIPHNYKKIRNFVYTKTYVKTFYIYQAIFSLYI